MAAEVTEKEICQGCGLSFKAEELVLLHSQRFCTLCGVEAAEWFVPEGKQRSSSSRDKQLTIVNAGKFLMIAVGLGVFLYQTPNIVSAFHEMKPIRRGTYRTDAETDQCIKNLWHISKLLQEGKSTVLLCPASMKPYKYVEWEDDIAVSCPSPHTHGLKDLQVSKRLSIPLAEK